MINKILKSKSGIIMAEALMAVTMIGAGVFILGGIITSAVQTSKLAKQYSISQNLITEGVESVMNIRSSNWLVHLNDRTKWLEPGVNEDFSYISKLVEDEWVLAQATKDLDLNNGTMDEFALCVYDIKSGYGFSQYKPCDAAGDPESGYYRAVKILDYVSNENLQFEVKVQWRDGVKVREAVQIITLYNYN